MREPGIYDGISNAEYHGGPGESKSTLDLVRKSPAHHRAARVEREAANDNEPRKPTPAQFIGTAFHALLLEPQEFARSYTLALRPQDVEGGCIESKDELLAMLEEINAGRKPKIATSGSKDELIARLKAEVGTDGWERPLEELTATELKACIAGHNADPRRGLLSTSGTMEQLAQTLRDAGRAIPPLWADVKADWARNNGHLQVLTIEQWEQLHAMRDAVMAHPAARALLTGAPGVAERSVYWRDPVTGLLCRCRPDFWRQDGIVVDVKTTEDASAEGFARSIANYRYHVQHPFYLDGINTMREQYKPSDPFSIPRPQPAKAFVFLAVEKSARVVDGVAMGVGVYVLDNDSVELGRIEYRQDLERIAACTRAGVWPGYSEKIAPIALPMWKLAQSRELLADAA
jgi:exodeoxyribonuclease VIII